VQTPVCTDLQSEWEVSVDVICEEKAVQCSAAGLMGRGAGQLSSADPRLHADAQVTGWFLCLYKMRIRKVTVYFVGLNGIMHLLLFIVQG
jgi:hypothetical protein